MGFMVFLFSPIVRIEFGESRPGVMNGIIHLDSEDLWKKHYELKYVRFSNL